MLRKLTHIALSFFMLISTTGFTVSRHYCGDQLKSVVVDGEAHSCCSGTCNACHNDEHFVQLKADFTPGAVITELHPLSCFETAFELFEGSTTESVLLLTNRIINWDVSPPIQDLQSFLSFVQTWRL